jgi:hypothetical protein
MKIPSTKGLMPGFREMDRAAREKKRGTAADIMAAADALMKAQGTLNPNLSGPKHNRDFQDHLRNFII